MVMAEWLQPFGLFRLEKKMDKKKLAAFELCTNLTVKPLALRYLIAYIPSQLLAFAYVWFSGLREPLAKTAYRDIWINFTGLFVLLCIINTVIYVFKKKRGQEKGNE